MVLFRKGFILSCTLAALALSGGSSALVLADPTPEAAIAGSLKTVYPQVQITQISESMIPGLYEVMLGPDLIYVSHDGRYLLDGDILDLQDRLNLSEEKRATARGKVLAEVPSGEWIEFAPADPGHTLYVFTDISCSFCRLLHRDVPELNRLGIAVRYLAFPRMGTDSPTFRDMESVWCAGDRQKALTDAKLGLPIKKASCDNPVRRHFILGQAIGISGTPGVYTEDGRRLPGYMPPGELLHALQQ